MYKVGELVSVLTITGGGPSAFDPPVEIGNKYRILRVDLSGVLLAQNGWTGTLGQHKHGQDSWWFKNEHVKKANKITVIL